MNKHSKWYKATIVMLMADDDILEAERKLMNILRQHPRVILEVGDITDMEEIPDA